jgi:flagellar biosynthetic protein FliP
MGATVRDVVGSPTGVATRAAALLILILLPGSIAVAATQDPAGAQGPDITAPEAPDPEEPTPGVPDLSGDDGSDSTDGVDGAGGGTDGGAISIEIGTPGDEGSQSVLLIVGLAVLSLAPSLVLMLSSFTRIIVVFSLTRNALGLQGVPPNQVLVGLALFLSVFVMAPTLSEVNEEALQPYLDGDISQEAAYERATGPMHEFMLDQTRPSELELLLDAAGEERPESSDDVGLSTLIPAFLLSELKTAFIMGFVIFIPFLVIDLIVASVLMALGMMMLPPVFVSLPFKLLLFVMVGGWSLIVETLLASFG